MADHDEEPTQSLSGDIVEVEIEPKQAEEIWEKTRNGNSTILGVKLTNNHYYDYARPLATADELIAIKKNLGDKEANRVLEMMEKESDASIEWEQKQQAADIEFDRKILSLHQQGLWGGIALTCILIAVGVFALLMNQPNIAWTIFGLTIGMVLAAVVLRRHWRDPSPKEE